MVLKSILTLSCLNQVPTFLKLYFTEIDIKYKNEILFVIFTQTLIGSISDIYRLVYNYKNYLSSSLRILDMVHVSCISVPVICYTVYINDLTYINHIQYFLYALLFWYNSYIIYTNNTNVDNILNDLSIWNHVLWHLFMGVLACVLL